MNGAIKRACGSFIVSLTVRCPWTGAWASLLHMAASRSPFLLTLSPTPRRATLISFIGLKGGRYGCYGCFHCLLVWFPAPHHVSSRAYRGVVIGCEQPKLCVCVGLVVRPIDM